MTIILSELRNLNIFVMYEWVTNLCDVRLSRVLIYIIFFSFTDMDATECEKKRVEYIDDLTDLEKQFAILREQ